MRRFLIFLSILLPGPPFAAPAYSFAKAEVFAREPEWEALAEETGGTEGSERNILTRYFLV